MPMHYGCIASRKHDVDMDMRFGGAIMGFCNHVFVQYIMRYEDECICRIRMIFVFFLQVLPEAH